MYYIVYGIFYLLSLLPWFIIYFLSDCVYLIVYYVFGYRKKIVRENMRLAFPDKTDAELKKIEKKFYKAFIDNFIEVIKFISISGKTLNKRYVVDYSLAHDLQAKGYNLLLLMGHYFNWEYTNLSLGKNLHEPFAGVYHPLSNKIFNKLFYKIRARFNTKLVSSHNFKNEFIPHLRGQYALGLIGDQNTGAAHKAYWLPFFGKMAPFVTGPEKSARGKNVAVIFVSTRKLKRGYYQSELKLFTTNGKEYKDGQIIKAFVETVEEHVRQHPENYLWSHRRYKHKFTEEEFGHLVVK